MLTLGHQYILFYFLFQIMVLKKTKKVWNLQKAFYLRTIKICQFKYIYCIKHAYKFLLREQFGFAAIL